LIRQRILINNGGFNIYPGVEDQKEVWDEAKRIRAPDGRTFKKRKFKSIRAIGFVY
jgi:hypothetical protein